MYVVLYSHFITKKWILLNAEISQFIRNYNIVLISLATRPAYAAEGGELASE